MDYNSQLRTEAEKAVAPLFKEAGLVERQLAGLRKQLERERGNAESLERRLGELKARAGDRITGGQNSFDTYRRNLKRLAADLAASQEIARTLDAELVPAKESELVKVRAAIQAALLAVAAQVRPACEAEMVRCIDAALSERGAYMAACESLFAEYAGDFSGRNRVYPDGIHYRPDPRRTDFLIGTGLEEGIVDAKTVPARRGDYLAPPQTPAQAETPDTVLTVGHNGQQSAPESTIPSADDASTAPPATMPTAQESMCQNVCLNHGLAQEAHQDGQAAPGAVESATVEATPAAETDGDEYNGPLAVLADSPEGRAIRGVS